MITTNRTRLFSLTCPRCESEWIEILGSLMEYVSCRLCFMLMPAIRAADLSEEKETRLPYKD